MADAPSAPQTGKKTILIVEDETALSKALAKTLRDAGFAVTVSEDGTDALRLVKKQKYDLVLLDIIMPNKDGFAFLSMVKESGESGKYPIIVLSNLGQEMYMEKAKELGACEYLIKANSPMKLIVEKVQAMLGV